MTDVTLAEVLATAEQDGAAPRYQVPENWAQGRTAFGGFTGALLVNAARRDRPELPALRSALINFTAPVSQAPTIHSEVLREGRNITTIATRAEIDGKVAATGTFSFGHAQESQLNVGHTAPAAPPKARRHTVLFSACVKAPAGAVLCQFRG
ncbi:thioesterase family protein [Sulfitobacter sp. M13]